MNKFHKIEKDFSSTFLESLMHALGRIQSEYSAQEGRT